jgi:hypothetical protein
MLIAQLEVAYLTFVSTLVSYLLACQRIRI